MKLGCGSLVLIVVGVVFVRAVFLNVFDFETPEQKVAREQAEWERAADNRRKGFHCLSGWDGSSREVVNYVKARLRDPDSFEHSETRITPADGAGNHVLLMEYRARNGFGGMNVEVVRATIRGSDCSASDIVMLRD